MKLHLVPRGFSTRNLGEWWCRAGIDTQTRQLELQPQSSQVKSSQLELQRAAPTTHRTREGRAFLRLYACGFDYECRHRA